MPYITHVFVTTFILSNSIISAKQSDQEDHDDDSHDVWRAMGITTLAGFASFLGAVSIFCIKREQIGVLPCSLAFSAGVTIYLSFVNLIPESVAMFDSDFYALLCVIAGVLLTLAMETLFHHFGVDVHNHSDPEQKSISYPDDTTTNELMDSVTEIPQKNIKKLSKTAENYSHISYSVAFALILHHFPEGIATFVSLYHDLEFGVLVAFALALHDVPSGICIAVPTYLATGSKVKPFFLCFIAALVYPAGAFIGWLIITYSSEKVIDIFVAILLGVTGGIMLYISFVELLPAAIIAAKTANTRKNQNNKTYKNVYTFSIVLLFAGFLIVNISNILLNAVGGHDH